MTWKPHSKASQVSLSWSGCDCFKRPPNHMANMYALCLTIHVGQQLQDGCPHLKLLVLVYGKKKMTCS